MTRNKLISLMWILPIWIITSISASIPETVPLYVSNGTAILCIYTGLPEEKIVPVISTGIERAVGVAVDVREELLFWTDIGKDNHGLYRAKLDGSQPQQIVEDVLLPNGLTVDWVSQHLYWTDEARGTVEMSDYDGTHRIIIIHDGLLAPRGIVVDPINGFVFYGDLGLKKIWRSKLDGSERQIIVPIGLMWPNQLTVSISARTLYWVDAYNKSMESCNYEGGQRRRVISLLESSYSAPLFGVAVVNASGFISARYDGAVYSLSVEDENEAMDYMSTFSLGLDYAEYKPLRTEADYISEHEVFSLAIADISIQPPGTPFCLAPGRGGCSHICFVISRDAYRCDCPTYGIRILSDDNATCIDPKEMLFYADKDKGHVAMLPLIHGNVSRVHIIASSPMPVAVAYDPILREVYWSDVREQVIYKINLLEMRRREFLTSNHGLGTVDGILVDWVHRRLYFSNMGSSSQLDGSSISWHQIEMVGLDGHNHNRRTVSRNVEKPRALALDLENGYLCFSDWGHKPAVYRTDLDGENQMTLLNSSQVSNPNGIAVFNNTMYVVDSNYNRRVDFPYLGALDMREWTFRILEAYDIFVPFGVAVNGQRVFYADWVTTEPNTGALYEFDLRQETPRMIASHMGNPTGLVCAEPQTRSSYDACATSGCSHMCVPTPVQATERYRCLCPDLSGLSLSSDLKTCHVPTNFLLFTDLNTIKMKPLDGAHDTHVYTVYYGDDDANLVALVYDSVTRNVYWSDLNRRVIMKKQVDSLERTAHLFYQTDVAIDDLAIDPTERYLYWTGYNSLTGLIAKMSLNGDHSTYTEILSGLDMPRALALDLNNSYLYWTEYGRSSGLAKLCRALLDGTGNETLTSADLHWPNALDVDGDKLYLADGSHRRIDAFSLEGGNRSELPYLTDRMEHVFGLAVFGNALYYTDWYTNSTNLINLQTGDMEIVAANLSRPSSVVLHHPTDLAVSSICSEDEELCSDSCVPVPGSYHCTCPLGRQLAEDRHTCLDVSTQWELVEDFRCGYGCSENMYCARLVPTVHFQCVCMEGYELVNDTACHACRVDTFKPGPGNSSCNPCPAHSSTMNNTGAVVCHCRDVNLTFSDGRCVSIYEPLESSTSSVSNTPSILNSTLEPVESNTSHSMPAENLSGAQENVSSTPGVMTSEENEIVVLPGTLTTITIVPTPPVILNCPTEPIVLYLPEFGYQTYLNIELKAHDSLGQNIPLMGTHDVPPGAVFYYMGVGPESVQHIQYVAEDEWGHETWCEFTLQVRDRTPPQFTRCPKDIEVNITRHSQRVFWEEPLVMDNIGVEYIMQPRWHSGSRLQAGVWPITYRAFDKDGTDAWCNFTVTVHRISIHCDSSHLRNPRHGSIVCNMQTEGGHQCETVCENKNYVLNPNEQYHSIHCDADEGEWINNFPEDYRTRACLKKNSRRRVEKRMQLWFIGPCDSDLKQEIVQSIIAVMRHDGLCLPMTATTSTGDETYRAPCQQNAFEVHCVTEGDKRRRKRDSSFRVEITVKADADVEENVTSVAKFINETANKIEDRFEHGLSFTLHGNTYTSLHGSTSMHPLELQCPPGSVDYVTHCLLCPVGSYHDVSKKECIDCPPGRYQDDQGQTDCKSCPDGAISNQGAVNKTDCYFPDSLHGHRLTSHDAIILGIVAAIICLLAMLLAIICWRRAAVAKSGHTKLTQTIENPYVIAVGKENEDDHEDDDDEDDDDGDNISQNMTESSELSQDEKLDGVNETSTLTPSPPPPTNTCKKPRRDFLKKKRKSSKAKLPSRNSEEICLEVQKLMHNPDKSVPHSQPTQSKSYKYHANSSHY